MTLEEARKAEYRAGREVWNAEWAEAEAWEHGGDTMKARDNVLIAEREYKMAHTLVKVLEWEAAHS